MRTLLAITIGGLVCCGASPSPAQDLVSLELLPPEVEGGTDSLGRVTLDATVGGELGVRVDLSSSDPSLASVPSVIHVFSGDTSSDFTIGTGPVNTKTTVTISASLNGVTKTAVLTLDPPAPRPVLRMGSFFLT